ncbi:hypothetical protein [Methylotuvimicrobium sp. KM2]|uniref:hypothetical protein n=1 Tax=Methylotuvimicrobium sp. KM2 TaxID=3133976 RepID=UPI003100B504
MAKKRPEYTKEWDAQAFRLSLLGLDNTQLAAYFEISRATLQRYCKAHPTFGEAIESGKLRADSKVAEGLFKRATGFETREVKTKMVLDESGNEMISEIIETVSEIPPDSKAAMQWLNNRQSKYWRPRVNPPQEINISAIPWAELRQITEQAVKKAQEQYETVIQGRYERLGIKREYSGD